QIGFNYLGRFAGAGTMDWSTAGEGDALGGGCDPAMPLAHALAINALTLDAADGARLNAIWSWAPALLSEAEAGDLARGWFAALGRGAGGAGPPRGSARRGWPQPVRSAIGHADTGGDRAAGAGLCALKMCCRSPRCRRACCSMPSMTGRRPTFIRRSWCSTLKG